MDVIIDWNLGNMIYNGLITLRHCGFPFAEIRVVSQRGKKGEREGEEVLLGHRGFLFHYAGPANTVGGDRDSSMLGTYLPMMTCPSIISESSHPTLPRWVAR